MTGVIGSMQAIEVIKVILDEEGGFHTLKFCLALPCLNFVSCFSPLKGFPGFNFTNETKRAFGTEGLSGSGPGSAGSAFVTSAP